MIFSRSRGQKRRRPVSNVRCMKRPTRFQSYLVSDNSQSTFQRSHIHYWRSPTPLEHLSSWSRYSDIVLASSSGSSVVVLYIPDSLIYGFTLLVGVFILRSFSRLVERRGRRLVDISPTRRPHLNEQPADYWIDKFQREGMEFRRELTASLRDEYSPKKMQYRDENLLVFERSDDRATEVPA